MRFLWLCALALASTSSAQAANSTITKLIRDMNLDCVAYNLTDRRHRGPMRGEDIIWIILNEGPSPVAVFADDGSKVDEFVAFDGKSVPVFVGDRGYTFSVGLSSSGSANVYVCRK